MAHLTITAAALIPAPATCVFALIADYHDGHQRILPKPPLVSLDVEQGGTGAGTRIHVTMHVLGQRQTFHGVVTEPEPGRTLVETNDNNTVTTFTVQPRNDGHHSYVTITTVLPVRSGLIGVAQRWLATVLLRPSYRKELANLAVVAAQVRATPSADSRLGRRHTSST